MGLDWGRKGEGCAKPAIIGVIAVLFSLFYILEIHRLKIIFIDFINILYALIRIPCTYNM
jgi:hypothetical protein